MTRRRAMLRKLSLVSIGLVLLLIAPGAIPAAAQRSSPRDPAEPAQAKPQPKLLARPAEALRGRRWMKNRCGH